MTVIVEVFVKPDRVEDFLALALGHAACSRLEPGCLAFEVLQERGRHWCQPLFTLHEVWRDADAIEAHRQTAHFMRWSQEIVNLQSGQRTHRDYMPVASKLLDAAALSCLGAAARSAGKSIAFTNGCFDVLHAGHVHLLREASGQADLLVVALNGDASVRELKGPSRPIHAQQQRAEVIAALDCVDHVCVFDAPTPLELVRALHPDVMVKGDEYLPEQIAGSELLAEWGGRVHLVEMLPGHSSTRAASLLWYRP